MPLANIYQQVDTGNELMHVDGGLIVLANNQQPFAHVAVKVVQCTSGKSKDLKSSLSPSALTVPLGANFLKAARMYSSLAWRSNSPSALPAVQLRTAGVCAAKMLVQMLLTLIKRQAIHLVQLAQPLARDFGVEVQVQAAAHVKEGVDLQLSAVILVELFEGSIDGLLFLGGELLPGASLRSRPPHHWARGCRRRAPWRSAGPGRQHNIQDV
eukprot:CAMPEP_0181420544 /NCGR_PEP_ID=MMETSP1110-20121109/12639_1 /TAXON_ID=174948 /ORGANISM="Symbiodinium sp., Strain CCMP421" /LENGTH=211 /DNA_ID=CAMNT_0023543585 /DNA_START=288 /DNA_END=923 /DNA_ORIENTATION=-